MKMVAGAAFLVSGVIIIGLLISAWLIYQEKVSPIACTMDAMLCPDGTSVGRSGPDCSFAPCPPPTLADEVQIHIDSKKDFIVLESPERGATITSPITIAGQARGTWYFEASFPVAVIDWDGRIIGEGVAEALDDWMTEEFVPFRAVVYYTLPENIPYRSGAIILKKDNPSGLPEHDDALEVPISF